MVGRTLHRADAGAELVDAIAAEVTLEVAALGAAERGELSDRAEQATGLSHPDLSPAQVAGADAVLRADALAIPEASPPSIRPRPRSPRPPPHRR